MEVGEILQAIVDEFTLVEVGEILQAKACKISPPNIHPLTGMGPPGAGSASPASLPSVVLASCAGPILGPELTGNNRLQNDREKTNCRQTADRIEKRGSGVDSASLQERYSED